MLEGEAAVAFDDHGLVGAAIGVELEAADG
jgi:hypothetical protein